MPCFAFDTYYRLVENAKQMIDQDASARIEAVGDVRLGLGEDLLAVL